MPPAPLVPPRPFILNELTWKTVRDARYEVAVLPWGATEAHNRHLPYSTDNIETERIAALAAGHAWQLGARVVVLPVVPFGVNTLQLDIPLCLNLNPRDRKSTRLNSSHGYISYAVFCLKKKKTHQAT